MRLGRRKRLPNQNLCLKAKGLGLTNGSLEPFCSRPRNRVVHPNPSARPACTSLQYFTNPKRFGGLPAFLIAHSGTPNGGPTKGGCKHEELDDEIDDRG